MTRPFYQSPQPVPAPSRRLLLLSYHFPPGQAVGALRWEMMSRYAARRGWGLDVVTLDPASLSSRDDHRLTSLPVGIRVFGVPVATFTIERVEQWLLRWRRRLRSRAVSAPATTDTPAASPPARPGSLGRTDIPPLPRGPRDLLRAYFAWREYARDAAWARQAAAVALAVYQPGVHRAVISCGPIHMAHDGARRVSLATGLPLVIDLRDPWSLVQRVPEHIASPVWFRLAAWRERQAVQRAALTVTNTPALCLSMQRLYPRARDRVITVLNGYDDDPVPPARHGRRFTIAYAGAVYLDRDPRPLFRAAARLVRERGLTPETFGVEFMGEVGRFDGLPLEAVAAAEGLPGFVHIRPAGPRRAALEFLAAAPLLVSLPQDSDMAIPSKVYEYVKFDAWVLALAEPGSATAEVLAGTTADVVSPSDEAALYAALARRQGQFASGERPVAIANAGGGKGAALSRAHQAGLLLDALDSVVSGSSGDHGLTAPTLTAAGTAF